MFLNQNKKKFFSKNVKILMFLNQNKKKFFKKTSIFYEFKIKKFFQKMRFF